MTMLMIGQNLLSAADKMQNVDAVSVFDKIHNPTRDFMIQIEQLRAVRTIDVKQYATMKRSLPYFVCGCFNQPFRRLENFAYTDSFVIDIDHLSENDLNIYSVKQQLRKDRRVVMCFVSPGNDGIKVLFQLKERCYDPEVFKLFYKVFVQQFSKENNFDHVIDSRTCDVTRACFVSADSNAYFNINAESIDMDSYIDMDNAQGLLDMKNEMSRLEDLLPTDTGAEEVVTTSDPDEQALMQIKQTLSLRKKKIVEQQPVFVPEILNEIIGNITYEIENTGIMVIGVSDIQYGKKIQVKMGTLYGEVNVFYGRNGFTVVQSPKRGTTLGLNEATAELIEAYLEDSGAKDVVFLQEKIKNYIPN